MLVLGLVLAVVIALVIAMVTLGHALASGYDVTADDSHNPPRVGSWFGGPPR